VIAKPLQKGFLSGHRRGRSIIPQIAHPSNLSHRLLRLGYDRNGKQYHYNKD
jgi:hypothetical protein